MLTILRGNSTEQGLYQGCKNSGGIRKYIHIGEDTLLIILLMTSKNFGNYGPHKGKFTETKTKRIQLPKPRKKTSARKTKFDWNKAYSRLVNYQDFNPLRSITSI
ncbi:hypothetical protein CHS0354_003383 [Potamilus streckersoni]|uniref:Uncharacterized protein n=1 Tax=Potamilus streckersoni TaxID=2493646 RepID=A0AAE0SUV2_9BIVA|nr:hypothetical protein CHS0354_003383 [Potamilus streckersoni]